MNRLFKLLLSLVLPTMMIVASVFLYLWLDFTPSPIKSTLTYLPYGIFFIGMMISFIFNRSRIFFIFLTLLICLASLHYLSNGSKESYLYTTALYILIGIFLPLNLLIFSTLKERGFLTPWGIMRLILISGEFFYISRMLIIPNHVGVEYLYREYLVSPIPLIFPQSVGIAIGLGLLIMIMKMYFFPTYSDASFVSGIVIGGFILLVQDINALAILFSTFGILLIFSIILDSYRMSYLDELTGLPGRRALKEEMMKLSGSYTVAMLDIDFFKSVNDKHGHDIGDAVLKMVASTLNEVSGGGKAFRYGGEEFSILFPNKRIQDVLPHLEELRVAVAEKSFVVRNRYQPKKKPSSSTRKVSSSTRKPSSSVKPSKKLRVTISIGVADKTKEMRSPQEVMKKADQALYRAKKKGRNCISK